MVKRTKEGISYYRQIADILILRIQDGVYGVGDKLPSAEKLGREFGHNRHTVRQALMILETQKLVSCQQGRGTFVLEQTEQFRSKQERLLGFIEMTREQYGKNLVTQVISVKVQSAGESARFLNIEEDDLVTHLHRLRLIDGKPMIMEYIYVPQTLCAGLEEFDPIMVVHSSFMIETYGLKAAAINITLEPIVAQSYSANLLQIPIGSPMMLENRVTLTAEGIPFEYSRHLYRGDSFTFTSHLKADS